jgi:hypothetical protein
MRKLVRASVLVMALAMPAFAGEIPNMVTSTPPPSDVTQPGEIPNGVARDIPYGVTSSEPTTAEALIDLLFALVS